LERGRKEVPVLYIPSIGGGGAVLYKRGGCKTTVLGPMQRGGACWGNDGICSRGDVLNHWDKNLPEQMVAQVRGTGKGI